MQPEPASQPHQPLRQFSEAQVGRQNQTSRFSAPSGLMQPVSHAHLVPDVILRLKN
jgi:hypothetical protein